MLGEYFSMVSSFFSNVALPQSTHIFDENDNDFGKSRSFNCTKIPNNFDETYHFSFDEQTEPPLLEELEIYPDRMKEKSLAMLNPFQLKWDEAEQLFFDSDLPGPVLMYLICGANIFLAGKGFHFDYVYGLSLISTLGLYLLLQLMNCDIPIKNFISILGYGMVHIVWLSFIGIFIELNSSNGFILAVTSVLMATIATSQLLCGMTDQMENRLLFAYPIALIYTLFSFLAIF